MCAIDAPLRQQPARTRCASKACALSAPAKRTRAVTLEFPDNKLLAALGGRIRRISCGWNRSSVCASPCAAIWSRSKARNARTRRRDAARALCAAGSRRKRRPRPKSMRRSASPTSGARRMRRARSRLRRHARSRARARPAQAAYLDLMRTIPLVFGIGPAGTGKTYLAAAFGAHLLHERRVERLILSRPALEAGERLGFLPGDLKEKIDPYLRPLYDALFDVMGERCRPADGAGHDRSRAAGLHARAHADPRLCHPGRGAEHHRGPDEDVR